MVRDLMAPGEFMEVWVNTPLEVAEARDVKGLYKKARSGQLKNFTGIDSPYEAPELAELTVNTVELTAEEVRSYYEDFSNGVLWPLFHYLLDRIPLDSGGWDVYMRVNARFADVVAEHYQPGDMIWVQDYQLLLLPALLRQRLPDARIGFFLHIPFPASEVFRMLPWRADVLR